METGCEIVCGLVNFVGFVGWPTFFFYYSLKFKMNQSNSTHPEESLNIFVLTSSTPKTNQPLSYASIVAACQSLLKYTAAESRNLINTPHGEIVYTHDYEMMPIKIWNGSGIEIGSQVMRLGCRKKDLVIVIKNKRQQRILRQPSNNFDELRTSWKNQATQTERTQEEISQIIRRTNKDCVIGYVYLNDENSGKKSDRLHESSIVLNGIEMNVRPITGKENQQFQIRIDKKGDSTTVGGSNLVLTQLVDTMSEFYSQSHCGLESSVSKKFIKMSSIKPQRPKTQPKFIPYQKPHIQDLFHFISPKKLNKSIRLKSVKNYYHGQS